jgi:hypothetical protein
MSDQCIAYTTPIGTWPSERIRCSRAAVKHGLCGQHFEAAKARYFECVAPEQAPPSDAIDEAAIDSVLAGMAMAEALKPFSPAAQRECGLALLAGLACRLPPSERVKAVQADQAELMERFRVTEEAMRAALAAQARKGGKDE